MSYNIAIDGPAGAGKSTIAKQLAKKLGYVYVDTGAMYRAIALYLLREKVKPDDTEAVSNTCTGAEVTLIYQNGEQAVLLNGENVNGFIRTEEVGNMASRASAVPAVRERLLQLQRDLASSENVIMDGRDIGTCVLPNADVKIFLTANSAVRAKRRYEELLAKGTPEAFEKIEKDIIERDARDRNREIAPLRQAEDAYLVDTSDMDIPQIPFWKSAGRKDADNMEVILAESAGFCFGVKRAVDKVYEQIASGKKIYTYGPIIHNEFVVQDLEKKGVQVIECEEELEKLTEGTVVIRSHGVPKSI